MKKRISCLIAMTIMSVLFAPFANAASENWRDPFVTRIMKTISQDPTYTDAVLTDLDRNGIPEAFIIKKGKRPLALFCVTWCISRVLSSKATIYLGRPLLTGSSHPSVSAAEQASQVGVAPDRVYIAMMSPPCW